MKEHTVVLLGFGGPSAQHEIRPFLDRVLQGRPIPPDRYEQIVQHYLHMGGRSPFNDLTQRQADALARELLARGLRARVRTAYLNAAPFVADVVSELHGAEVEAPIAVILAAHRSPASWDKYLGLIPGAIYTEQYFDHPLFIEAHAQRIRDALQRLGKAAFDDVTLIFTAHSIPQAMADRSPYAAQFRHSAQLIAARAGAASWRLAFQSRSGSPAEKWLEPDIRDVLPALRGEGVHDTVVAPIGFLCDHVEVLYDLDVEAASIAREAGVRMQRAGALNDHPLFIRMLADLVERCAA